MSDQKVKFSFSAFIINIMNNKVLLRFCVCNHYIDTTYCILIVFAFCFFRSAKMRESEYQKIKSQYDRLVRELDLANTNIIDRLFQDGVLAYTDKEAITQLKTHHERNRLFLGILQKKEDAAYRMFYDALREDQDYLAEILPLPGVPRTKSSRPSGSGNVRLESVRPHDRLYICWSLQH